MVDRHTSAGEKGKGISETSIEVTQRLYTVGAITLIGHVYSHRV